MPNIRRAFVRLLAAVIFVPALVHAADGYTPGSFTVNDTGAANYSIPIAVPPGAAGMQPSLALTYNSQGGNGLLGMGWSLSGLSAITRCPQTYATDFNAGGVDLTYNDRYCLDGQRLILINGTYGYANSEYRTERDTLTKIVAYGAAGN
ncbi:MAG: SpvB/TcaC N-terminal domain-containing protein, partial [Gammaproteobacteria bacterium]